MNFRHWTFHSVPTHLGGRGLSLLYIFIAYYMQKGRGGGTDGMKNCVHTKFKAPKGKGPAIKSGRGSYKLGENAVPKFFVPPPDRVKMFMPPFLRCGNY